MTLSIPAGYTRNRLPYSRFGSGSRPLIVFQGLAFENKPTSERMARFFSGYSFLDTDYMIYLVGRKSGLPYARQILYSGKRQIVSGAQ